MIIYAIPGLGTTDKLYINTVIQNHKVVVLNWPLPTKNETMQSYAQKFLPQINTTEPFCLMGVSFGGMLCTELGKVINPQKIFLISSSKTRNELPWFIKALKYLPIHKLLSENSHRKLAYHGKWFVGFGGAYIPEFLGMVNSMTPNYFKYCIHTIATWNGANYSPNTIHIHGKSDKLLFYSKVKANYTIKDGSHAMVVFRAQEINEIIEKELLASK